MRTQTTDDGDVILASGEEPIMLEPSKAVHVTMGDYLKANYVSHDEMSTRLSYIGMNTTRLKTDVIRLEDSVDQLARNELKSATAVGNIRSTQAAQATRIREIEEKMLTLTWIVAILFLATAASVAKLFFI